jgi:hypothetical protein
MNRGSGGGGGGGRGVRDGRRRGAPGAAAGAGRGAGAHHQRPRRALLIDWVLPFEVLGVLLVAALLGAVYVARTED